MDAYDPGSVIGDVIVITLSNARGQPQTLGWYEQGQGPLVVLMHGFPDTEASFTELIPRLVSAGYRVLVPRMRGYETSTQNDQDAYYLLDLADDLVTWLDQLNEPAAHVIGHDFGALAAYVAAATYPQRILTLTTLAIPHLKHLLRGLVRVPVQLQRSSYLVLMQLPSWLQGFIAAGNYQFLEMLWRRWSPSWNFSHADLEKLKTCFAQEGVLHAATQYYRCLRNFHQARGRASWQALLTIPQGPTLMLTGSEDGCMDTRLYDVMIKPSEVNPKLTLHRLQGCGHWLHRESPDEVARLWLSWVS